MVVGGQRQAVFSGYKDGIKNRGRAGKKIDWPFITAHLRNKKMMIGSMRRVKRNKELKAVSESVKP